MAPFSLLVPVVGLWAAFGEMPGALQWVGAGAALLGLVVNQFGGWGRAGR